MPQSLPEIPQRNGWQQCYSNYVDSWKRKKISSQNQDMHLQTVICQVPVMHIWFSTNFALQNSVQNVWFVVPDSIFQHGLDSPSKVLSSSLPVVSPSHALGFARPSPSPPENRRMDRMITWSFTLSCPILRLDPDEKMPISYIFLWLARLAGKKKCRNNGPPQPLCQAGHLEVASVQSPASFLLPHVANL